MKKGKEKRERERAMVIDCEMAGIKGRQKELIQFTVIGSETGEVLVNS